MAIIIGTGASETLPGTAGSDTIIGGGGDDLALMGAGADVYMWTAGDGNDTVEGEGGVDTMVLTASDAGSQIFEFVVAGGRIVGALSDGGFGVGSIDFAGFERLEYWGLSGADRVIFRNVPLSGLSEVAVDLSASGGASDGDGDQVIWGGGAGNEAISVAAVGGTVSVTGLPGELTVTGADAIDELFLLGGAGNDKLDGSKLPNGLIRLSLIGEEGNDTLNGHAGNNTLNGGAGNDTVTGGGGNDFAILDDDDDWFLWSAGHGNDTVHGGAGTDTVRFTGTNSDEAMVIAANGANTLLQRDLEAVSLDLRQLERIEIRALGGADNIVVNDLAGTATTEVAIDLAATAGGKAADTKIDTVTLNATAGADLVDLSWSKSKIVTIGLPVEVSIANAGKTDQLVIDGGDGNDVINAGGLGAGKVFLQVSGGSGDDTIFGSAGNDTVTGGIGNDRVVLGSGNDVFVWSRGDGNDFAEGQGGIDTLRLAGSNTAAETMTVAVAGGRLTAVLDVVGGEISGIDAGGFERIEYRALGGSDRFFFQGVPLSGITEVALDLSATGSGGGSDSELDQVLWGGGGGSDVVNVAVIGAAVSVTGLPAKLTITDADAFDDLIIVGGAGNDKLDGSKLPAGTMRLGLHGELGNDSIVGSAAVDTLNGGGGNDTITSGGGSDLVVLKEDDDWFLWNSGDGNDQVFADTGTDTVRFTGVNADEAIKVIANGVNTLLQRDLEAVSLDLRQVERIEIRALGGADGIVVNDLTGTTTAEVAIDLAATAGGKAADTKIDTVTIKATAGDDNVTVATSGGKIVATGLAAQASIANAGKTDHLLIDGGEGEDVIDASLLAAGKIAFTMNGGLDADTLKGGAGNDTVNGGAGDDTAHLGAGDDLFVWNFADGKDTVEGGAGTDTLQFNSFDGGEIVTIGPDGGGGVKLFATSFGNGPVLNDVERIQFNALEGDDLISLDNVTGTDLTQVVIDLGVGGVGDGALDMVAVAGTSGNDKITVALSGGAVTVTGLTAKVTIMHAETDDVLVVTSFGGNDTINAGTLPSGIGLRLEGGTGNDTITGNAGHNTLDGEDDNDKLNGGGGNDSLNGGSGSDTLNAGAGDDTLDGGADNDNLDGGTGNDAVDGGFGKDSLNGGAGNDTVTGGQGDDSVNVASGNDVVRYTSVLDGHDLVIGFDGNAAGGQDTLNLDALFDNLGVAAGARAGRVSITDNGASVEIAVDTNGDLTFDLAVATLKTADLITLGQDIVVGT